MIFTCQMELLMSNVSGIGDAYYWSVFKIAEAFGL
ncbi:terminase, partial [Escherichia coli]